MKKRITQQQEGTLFLLILSFILWFLFEMYSNTQNVLKDWIEIIITAIVLSIITTIALTLLFSIMKNWFKW